jgi:hypothetical protein
MELAAAKIQQVAWHELFGTSQLTHAIVGQPHSVETVA